MEAGMKLIKYLSDHSVKWTREAGHLPVRKDVLESAEFKELEKSQAFAASLDSAHYYPPIIKQSEVFGREATSPFVIMIESAMLDQTTPEEAVSTAADTINDILAE
jgi:ABC-type glycerol-3-phosphate transport system substrate-binding protein